MTLITKADWKLSSVPTAADVVPIATNSITHTVRVGPAEALKTQRLRASDASLELDNIPRNGRLLTLRSYSDQRIGKDTALTGTGGTVERTTAACCSW